MRFIFSILIILFVSTQVFSQKKDTVKRERDWAPSFVMTGIDPARMVIGAFGDVQTFEGMAAIDFDTYLFVLDFGRSSISRVDQFDYQSAGTFYRMGIHKNFALYNEEGNVFSVGLSYARANFDQNLSFDTTNDFYGDISYDLMTSESWARWWELNGMIQIKVWQQLYFGYEVSLKFLKKVYDSEDIETWDIPGFGRNKRSGTELKGLNVGLNYYVTWRFELREKVIPNPRK